MVRARAIFRLTTPTFMSVRTAAGITNAANPSGPDVLDRRYGMKLEIDAELGSRATNRPRSWRCLQYESSARRENDVQQRRYSGIQLRSRLHVTCMAIPFGNACITARNLLRSNLGTRFMPDLVGSWDHHVNIYAPNSNLQVHGEAFDSGLGRSLPT